MNGIRARRGHLARWGIGIALTVSAVGATLLWAGLSKGPPTLVRTSAGLGPAPGSATGNDRPFLTKDSVTVIGRQLPARSRGTVVILQGLGEPDSLFVRWSTPLNLATDMNIIALALRGNGRSRDTVRTEGSPARYALDIDAVVRELRRRNPSGPVIAVATHGGLGLLATYLTSRRDADLLPFDGVIAMDGAVPDIAHAPDNRPVMLYARRTRTLDVLSEVGITWFDDMEVASQSADGNGALATRWSYGSWRATRPTLTPLLLALESTATRALILSTRERPTKLGAELSWVRVAAPIDVANGAITRAISGWSAEYAADAYEPIPPKATQTLDVLRRP